MHRQVASLDRPDVKIQMHTLSAEDPRDPNKLVLDRFPGFGIGSFALATLLQDEGLLAAPPGKPPMRQRVRR